MRTDVRLATVHAPADVLELISLAADDLCSAGRIAELRLEAAEGGLRVDVLIRAERMQRSSPAPR